MGDFLRQTRKDAVFKVVGVAGLIVVAAIVSVAFGLSRGVAGDVVGLLAAWSPIRQTLVDETAAVSALRSETSAVSPVPDAPSLADILDKQKRGQEEFARMREYRLSQAVAVAGVDGIQPHGSQQQAGRSGVTLAVVGDIMLSRTVAERMRIKGQDYPFLEMADWLSQADLAFGNLETPIIAGKPVAVGEMNFRADTEVAAAVAKAGLDIVNLANNHLPDRGEAGVRETLKQVDAAGLVRVGAGLDDRGAYAPTIINQNGLRLAFIAQTDARIVPARYGAAADRAGIALIDVEKLKAAVTEARRQADVVIFSMHAGAEYKPESDSYQRLAAYAAINAGADLVIGHHPHVVQPIEIYQGRLIMFSLGNFIFDQTWSAETQQGLAVRLTLTHDRITRVELVPVEIRDSAQPQPASAEAAKRILARLKMDYVERSGASGYDLALSDGGLAPFGGSEQPTPADRFSLKDGVLRLAASDGNGGGSQEAWRTPDDWWVDGFQLTDIDGDGQQELAVSVWKTGRYGEDKPFWIEDNDDDKVMNRMFIYRMAAADAAGSDTRPESRWMSSALPAPNCRFGFRDLDDDGREELVALEGDYADFPGCAGRAVSVWKWGEWGFENVSRQAGGEAWFREMLGY